MNTSSSSRSISTVEAAWSAIPGAGRLAVVNAGLTSQRSRANGGPRSGFYALYLLVVLLIGAAFAWHTGSISFLPRLLDGLALTVHVTVLSAFLAIAAAFAAGLARLYAAAPFSWIAAVYVETFRGTSILVQLFWLYFVLPLFGAELSAFVTAVLALGLHIGAYGSELVRGSISGVGQSQWEAATALNIGRARTVWRIILPQALPAMVPAWGNLLIELLKATSVVSLITLPDLAFRTQQLNLATYRTAEVFTLALLLYLVLSLFITLAVHAFSYAIDRTPRTGR